MEKLNKKKILKLYQGKKEIEFEPHSVHHQIISNEYSTLRDDYSEIVTLYGYLIFFSTVAPLVPLIIFILTYVEVTF